MRASLRSFGLTCLALSLVVCAEIPTAIEEVEIEVAEPLIPPSTVLIDSLSESDSLVARILSPGPIAHRLFAWISTGEGTDSIEVSLELKDPSVEMGTIRVGGVDSARQRWIAVPAMAVPTEFRVVVRRLGSGTPLIYTLSLEPRDARTEHADSVLAPGDTLFEAVDGPNDVDVFKVTGVADRRLILFVGKRYSSSPTSLAVTAIAPGGDHRHFSDQVRGDHELEQRAIPLNIPAGQTWRISVAGGIGSGSHPSPGLVFENGQYMLWLVAANDAPESRSATVALRDTIADAIDYVGDADYFSVFLNEPRTLAVNLRLPDTVAIPVRLEMSWQYQLNAVVERSTPISSFEDGISHSVTLGPGEVTLRVIGAGQGLREQIVTPYEIEFYEVQREPEAVSASVTIGTSVVGESIERKRDTDDFVLNVSAGQVLRLESTGMVSSTFWSGNSEIFMASDVHRDSSGLMRASGPIQVTADGPALLRFSARDSTVGPYSFKLSTVNPAPETATPALAVNTLVTEAIDHPGDLDRFSLDVPTTAVYVGMMRRVVSPGVYGDSIFIGPVNRNAGSTFSLSASSTTFPFDIGDILTYELGAFAIDTMPEERPEAFAIGDTVVGVVDLRADVDVYKLTYSGPGEKLFRINWLQAPACFDDYPSMTMHVSISGEWSWGVYSPSTWQANNETFALSVPGTYSVRVASRYASWDGVGCHIPQYAFTIEEVTRP